MQISTRSLFVLFIVCIALTGVNVSAFTDNNPNTTNSTAAKIEVEAKRAKLNEIKITIAETKAKIETVMKDLRAQRDALQQKIKTSKEEFKVAMQTLRQQAKVAMTELKASIKKLKDSVQNPTELNDANITEQQVGNEENSITKLFSDVENMQVVKDIGN